MKHFLNRLGIRILSYFFIVIAFLSSVGCLNLNLGTDRSPSSKAKALAEKTSDLYIKYKLIKNLNLETISTKDCKAFAQQNSILCETVECKAILDDQELNCKDNLCKALINKREELCPDGTCRALITKDTEKCDVGDKICKPILEENSSRCDEDCRAVIEKSGGSCKSKQCKAIVYENMNFCE